MYGESLIEGVTVEDAEASFDVESTLVEDEVNDGRLVRMREIGVSGIDDMDEMEEAMGRECGCIPCVDLSFFFSRFFSRL